MSLRPWYRRFPADFIASTIKLSAEEKGVYSTLIDHMYDRGGPIADDPKELARLCGCSTRRFNQIKAALVEKHQKIIVQGGLITQLRVVKQIAAEQEERAKLAENGAKGGEKSAENRRKFQDKERENKPTPNNYNGLAAKGLGENPQAPLPSPGNTPLNPPKGGGVVEHWDEFKKKWGASDANDPEAEGLFEALSEPDRLAAIASVAGYDAERVKLDRKRCNARKYLGQRRWEGIAPPPEAQRADPQSGYIIGPGSEEWEAWQGYTEANGDEPCEIIGGTMAGLESLMRSRNENKRICRVPSRWPPGDARNAT